MDIWRLVLSEESVELRWMLLGRKAARHWKQPTSGIYFNMKNDCVFSLDNLSSSVWKRINGYGMI